MEERSREGGGLSPGAARPLQALEAFNCLEMGAHCPP